MDKAGNSEVGDLLKKAFCDKGKDKGIKGIKG